eukprot:gnl/Spiro4/3027_TR1490_c0_g1_i1.p2 gnl/Spiro4/3027_TR1490_c0_g1~~gnl/Spiro4/3027_TR1490_c0_g1_i1.p2  ORF type:complete len:239 (-),score=75.40 gnl/Spiro4/3027_TR1490_c0_g1_i1:195-866(-)
MPPKRVNQKAVAANERKAKQKNDREAEASHREEEAFWQDVSASETSKRDKARAEAEARKREADQRRAETKRLMEEENAQLNAIKPTRAAKLTLAEIHALEAAERQKRDEALSARSVSEAEYNRAIEAHSAHVNRDDSIKGSGVEGALSALSVLEQPRPQDLERHPERRMKAAFAAFCDREMPRIRAEQPGLNRKQYLGRLHAEFKNSPDNPMNQQHVAYNARI